MGGNSYIEWEDGGAFIESLRGQQAELSSVLAGLSAQDKEAAAQGLADYCVTLLAKDPNALPPGLSETFDKWKSEGKAQGLAAPKEVLLGVKNDFYNLFDKHPNVMLTTGGVLGLGGGASLIKHYGGKSDGSFGGKLVALSNVVFQGEKVFTMTTGSQSKKGVLDDSLSGQLAKELAQAGHVPEGLDPDSPEGQLVKEAGGKFGKLFESMVRHREMTINNILCSGEGIMTTGYLASAFFDKEHIASLPKEVHKGKVRTAKLGLVNAASDTMLNGLTYYNQYIDPKLKELDASSASYGEDKKKIWADAPKEHMFKPSRMFARVVSKFPQTVREKIPNMAIGAAYMPLTGVLLEGLKGNGDGKMAKFQFFGAVAIMLNVLLNYTAITNRSKGQKVLNPEEAGQFTDMLAQAALQQQTAATEDKPAAIATLKEAVLAQSFMAPEYEGLVEEKLHAAFGVPFVAVKDHSKVTPISREPAILTAAHPLTRTVAELQADAADIHPDTTSLHFAKVPEATRRAVEVLGELGQAGDASHTIKALGPISWRENPEGGASLQLLPRALPVVVSVSKKLSEHPDLAATSKEQLVAEIQQSLQSYKPQLAVAGKQTAEPAR